MTAAARIGQLVRLTPEQVLALGWILTDAVVVIAWELLYIPAFQHSLGLYWTWYCIELALGAAFCYFSYRWLISTDGHRRWLALGCWILLLGVVGWRVYLQTERVAGMLRPLMMRS